MPAAAPRLFTIRANHEWAYVVIDEATGLFMAHGSYGSFCYVWPPAHRSLPLVEFLSRLDRDYFMSKCRGRAATRFDAAATAAHMHRLVLAARRQGECTRETARAAYDQITDGAEENHASERDFLDAILNSDDLTDLLGQDLWDMLFYSPAPDCVGFWRDIWPAFLEQAAADRVPA